LFDARRIASLAISGVTPSISNSSFLAYNSNPVIQSALTGAHSDFRRLLCDRLVREDPQPHLPPRLMKRVIAKARLNLAIRNITALQLPSGHTHRNDSFRPRLPCRASCPFLLFAVLTFFGINIVNPL